MKRYRVTTPQPKYTGESAGVYFKDGAAEVLVDPDNPNDKAAARIAYFREAGYTVLALDDDGEPVDDADGQPVEPPPGDDAPEWVWRMYAVQHAGMTVADVTALGDRADVMRAVSQRQQATTGPAAPAETKAPAKGKRGPRKASDVPGDDATDDELRQYVRAQAIAAGDEKLAKDTETMSRDELMATVKGQAK